MVASVVDFDEQKDPETLAEVGDELRKVRAGLRGLAGTIADLADETVRTNDLIGALVDEMRQTHGIVSDERRIRLEREKAIADAAYMAEHLADDEEPTKVD